MLGDNNLITVLLRFSNRALPKLIGHGDPLDCNESYPSCRDRPVRMSACYRAQPGAFVKDALRSHDIFSPTNSARFDRLSRVSRSFVSGQPLNWIDNSQKQEPHPTSSVQIWA
jgi:hypothetical protein